MNEYMEVYIAEAKELLDEMNDSLLRLEKSMGDIDLINSIFRAAHTIKGNSASLGFKRMENLTHSLEDLLQDIRDSKVEIDSKIMELLFVCHDFLESGLSTIMQTGNEEEVNFNSILRKLHSIISEKHSKLENVAGASQEKIFEGIDITLDYQELSELKKNLKNGLNAFLIKITINEDCAFKSVRIWMWFQEMSKYLNVIKADPDQPTSENIQDDSYAFNGNIVKLFVTSEYEIQQLSEELNKLSDVADIHAEPIILKETDFKENQIKLVMTQAALSISDIEGKDNAPELSGASDKERIIEIESEFLHDFINEIFEQLLKLETEIEISKQDLDEKIFKQKFEDYNLLNKLTRQFHTIKGLAGFIDNELIVNISTTTELLIEYFRKGKQGSGELLIWNIEASVALIRKICENLSLLGDRDFVNVVENHINQMTTEMDKEITVRVPEIKEAADADSSEDIGSSKEETKQTENILVESANNKELQQDLTELHTKRNDTKSLGSNFMRISTQKIDSLVDMLGELIIQHSLLEQEASKRFDSNDKYMNNLLRMAKIIKGIQNISMSLRMVSLKQVFQKIMRVGRDTAVELSKDADISIIGEETEIDRNIADKLLDPLMHLIRNSISHGIESEEERIKAGKSSKGQVNVRAYSKRGYVYIEIEDDGHGLDIDKIRAKAIEKNLIDSNINYNPEEIMKFIFLPGFSTKETVDNISGRGVGMNVVETEIKKVGGKIDIINRPGAGCTFVIKIPLNLAVMNGTVVDIYGERYIIPTLYIKQFFKPDNSQWLKVINKRSMIRVRNEVMQVIPIDEVFGIGDQVNKEDEQMVVIIEVEQKLKALPVRSVIGRQEIVAKPLEKEIGELDFISGVSILGDGKVSLILDVEAICKMTNTNCKLTS